MKSDAKKLYDRVQEIFNEIYPELRDLLDRVQRESATTPLPDMVDAGFLVREISVVFDELRKETNAREEMIAKVIAVRRTQECVADPTLSLRVKGEYAYGDPSATVRPKMPKKGTPEFAKLLEFLGVDPSSHAAEVMSPHYVRLSDLMTRLAESGRDIPREIVTSVPYYTTNFTRKNVKEKRTE